MINKEIIATNPNSNVSISLNIQTISIGLSAAVSLSILVGLVIKAVSNFSNLTADIKDLREDINSINLIAAEIKANQKELTSLDKRLDLHIQDYHNRVEVVNLITRQLDEKINHKFSRNYNSIQDIEKFLQSQGRFHIRESDQPGE